MQMIVLFQLRELTVSLCSFFENSCAKINASHHYGRVTDLVRNSTPPPPPPPPGAASLIGGGEGGRGFVVHPPSRPISPPHTPPHLPHPYTHRKEGTAPQHRSSAVVLKGPPIVGFCACDLAKTLL